MSMNTLDWLTDDITTMGVATVKWDDSRISFTLVRLRRKTCVRTLIRSHGNIFILSTRT